MDIKSVKYDDVKDSKSSGANGFGDVISLDFKKGVSFIRREPFLKVTLRHADYGSQVMREYGATATRGIVTRGLKMVFSDAADRNSAYKILSAIDPEVIRDRLAESTLHIVLTGANVTNAPVGPTGLRLIKR